MAGVDRSMLRAQLKKEHKLFIKNNPVYAKITLSQYSSLIKLTANQIKNNHLRTTHVHNDSCNHEEHDVSDMLLDLEAETTEGTSGT